MQGEFHDLKVLILKENPYAFYIHCFAHQLQLALVAVARRHIYYFFFTSSVVNVVSGSSKHCNILQDNQAKIVAEALENGEISRGRGLNQNTSLKRSGDTRWGSHYVIDMQLLELNNCFNEVNTELLVCMSCLSPVDLFYAFNKEKLIQFAEFYRDDFFAFEILALDDQLETYIVDMRTTLAYPAAIATVERSFSAMNIVKNKLRNRMGDQWMNDSLVVYIEKEICDAIDNETIMLRFQNMKTRRGEL
ncbi:uncharacterized protein LOC133830536 [Humulus lupulus]|uniref:uncharacterized protein LOC133830536 n=1 Tax=Humulus lupulus TaxID=3486 RepID=UPI002B40DB4E|nr:uncharacterized protein LOC133830536 [Humulus lupulus]